MKISDSIDIREARQNDLPSIVRLLSEDDLGQTRETFKNPLPAPYLQAFEEINASDSNELIVTTSENKVIGVYQITYIPYLTYSGGKRATIEGVRVDVNWRSQGVGQKMIHDAIERAKRRQCHMIQLTSNKCRTAAIQFYQSLGFEPTHEGLKLNLHENKAISNTPLEPTQPVISPTQSNRFEPATSPNLDKPVS